MHTVAVLAVGIGVGIIVAEAIAVSVAGSVAVPVAVSVAGSVAVSVADTVAAMSKTIGMQMAVVDEWGSAGARVADMETAVEAVFGAAAEETVAGADA